MKKYLWLIVILSSGLSACSTITDLLGLAKNINVTWNPNEGVKTIDSTKINFKPCYWKDTVSIGNYEREFMLDGYRVWILQTDSVRRIEVLKQDTVIKIFGK